MAEPSTFPPPPSATPPDSGGARPRYSDWEYATRLRNPWVMRVISLAFAFTTCYLAVLGVISPENFMSVVTMVVGFYFAKSQ